MHICIKESRPRGVTCLATLAFLSWTLLPAGASAEDALVAVATNFAGAIETLAADFEDSGDHRLTIATGSTGKLYAQIINGAPFDAFLAADRVRPERLEEESHAVPGSRFTYAIGQLVLWSADPGAIGPNGQETLARGSFRKLAIANPDLAPYGTAAREALVAFGLFERLRERLVMGENVGQAHGMVVTGNADLGFVAQSSIASARSVAGGSRWEVPQRFYTPILQDAVLLSHGVDNSAARAFLEYLKRPAVRAEIRRFGYGVE